MPITWHPTTSAELDAALAIHPELAGAALIGWEAARSVWARLLRHPACICATLAAEDRLVGFGASVFVQRSFLDAELAAPRPDLNSRLLAGFHAGQPVLLTREEIGYANAGAGLDVVIVMGVLVPERRWDLEAQTMSITSLMESHAGHRLARIAQEASAPWMADVMRQTGVFDVAAEFPRDERVLFVTSRQRTEPLVGSIARHIFLYRPPALDLRSSDQELLLAALRGATDEELAAALGLSLPAVKARWRSAFARIAEKRPDLITDPSWGHDGEATVRGAQKRHRVLAYVREHPSELRPYAVPSSSSPGIAPSRPSSTPPRS